MISTLILVKSESGMGKVEEGLRLAVAMIGMDHIPHVVFIGKGVECLLHEGSSGIVYEYLKTLSSLIEIHVFSESMIERGLKPEDLDVKATLIGIEHLRKMMRECKSIVAF
ncbi:MAG: DsrE family protein [Candidatus Bathyarchaeia archaeon]